MQMDTVILPVAMERVPLLQLKVPNLPVNQVHPAQVVLLRLPR